LKNIGHDEHHKGAHRQPSKTTSLTMTKPITGPIKINHSKKTAPNQHTPQPHPQQAEPRHMSTRHDKNAKLALTFSTLLSSQNSITHHTSAPSIRTGQPNQHYSPRPIMSNRRIFPGRVQALGASIRRQGQVPALPLLVATSGRHDRCRPGRLSFPAA